VYVEHDAGVGGGFRDDEYEKAGARLVYSGEEAYGRADLLLKIARPLKEELDWLRPGCTMMGLLHLASARKDKLDLLLEKNVTSIAYEQIRLPDGSHPVLRAFSQMCGSMTAQIAARFLQNNWGGKGILLGGVPGVPPAEVAILGAGTVGTYAAQAFRGLGSHVIVLDSSLAALQILSDRFPGIPTMIATKRNIERVVSFVDVLVGAVLTPGERTPQLVSREMVCSMKPRSVIIDIDIDEGGCVETARPTIHDNPVYVEEGVLHYCVPNMPGAVARTSTLALTQATLPYVMKLAELGWRRALSDDAGLRNGLQVAGGGITYRALAEDLAKSWSDPVSILQV
jgi:alanine dehydrogenase